MMSLIIEIQSTGELASDVVCFHSPDGIINGGRVGPASSMLFSLTTPTLTRVESKLDTVKILVWS